MSISEQRLVELRRLADAASDVNELCGVDKVMLTSGGLTEILDEIESLEAKIRVARQYFRMFINKTKHRGRLMIEMAIDEAYAIEARQALKELGEDK
jgi:phage terminase large subunit-like protein